MGNFISLVPKNDLFLKLQDGRHLGFAEYGTFIGYSDHSAVPK